MTFTPEQIGHLSAPLDRSNVAQRKQGSGQVSYIEGWHAIAEANRIFGFDSWTRETIDIRQLGEPREVDGKFRVDYMARIRVTVHTETGVFPIIREGCGFGQGIDRDVGQAHESALKEAETDAMKRALMTFGNPFGLALYDKTQSNVADAAREPINDAQYAEVVALIQGKGANTAAILRHYDIKAIKDLPADKFNEVRKRLYDLPAHQKEAA